MQIILRLAQTLSIATLAASIASFSLICKSARASVTPSPIASIEPYQTAVRGDLRSANNYLYAGIDEVEADVEEGAETTIETTDKVIDDAKDGVEEGAEATADTAEDIAEETEDAANDVGDTSKSAWEDTEEAATDAAEDTGEFVEDTF